MDKVLNFDHNYNGKLCSQYFTTIRTHATLKKKDLNIGDIVDIALNRKVLFSAQIESIEDINLNQLSLSQKTLLSLDTGLSWKQAVHRLKDMMKSNSLVVIHLHAANV